MFWTMLITATLKVHINNTSHAWGWNVWPDQPAHDISVTVSVLAVNVICALFVVL